MNKYWTQSAPYARPYMLPDQTESVVYLAACECGTACRGPVGGVCGNCAQAILVKTEQEES